MKKIISFILSLAMMLSIIPLSSAAEDYGDNLCLGKEAFADGIYQGQHHIFGIQFVNDGNENTQTATGTSIEPRSGFTNYIVIDLGENYNITNVIVRSRRDLDADWARQGFAAYIATKADFSDAVKIGDKNWAGAFKSDLEVELKTPTKARYIIAAGSNKTGGIVISEIEAYGSSAVGGNTGVYTDVTSAAEKNAVKVMSAFDVIQAKSDTVFGSTDLMTRGEAAMIMCKFANIPVGNEHKNSFYDVPADHAYAPYIEAGLDYGFISSDTYFRPDDYILGYEFLKMVLCINGYYEFTIDSLVYPTSIIHAARKTDLLDSIATDCMSYINKIEAAIIMYNTYLNEGYEYKNKELVPTDEGLIETIYGYRLMRGIVTANGVTSLETPFETVAQNRIFIDNTEYYDESGEGINYLGEKVYFLVNDDNEIKALWTDEDRCEAVTLYDYQIEDADFDVIEVENGKKTKKYRIEEHPYVIYNGAAYAGADETDLIPQNGYVTLIDNDNNGLYDIIKIYKPEIVYIDSANIDEEYNQIDVSDLNGEKYSYNPSYVNIYDSNGKQAAMSKLKQGRLAYFYESKTKTALSIELQVLSVTGSVTKTAGEYITIENEEYISSVFFEENFYPINVGDSAKFFIDKNGQLIYMIVDRDAESKYLLAVVRKFYIDQGTDDVTFKVYCEDKQFKDLKLADEVYVDGNIKDIAGLVSLGRNYFEGKLVQLRIKDEDTVVSITTESYQDGEIYKTSTTLTDTYRGSLGFYSGHKLVLPHTKTVPVFIVPIDVSTGKPAMTKDLESRYNIRDLSSMYSVGSQITAAAMTVFGCDEYGEAKAVISKEYYSSGAPGYGVIESYSSSGFMMFDSLRTNCDEYGDSYYSIYGYDISTGGRREIILEVGFDEFVNTFKIRNSEFYNDIPENHLPKFDSWRKNTFLLYRNEIDTYYVEDIENLQRGDIIRYDKGGYNNVSQLEMVAKNTDFDASQCKVVYYAGHEPTQIIVTHKLQYAIAKEIKDGHITYAYDENTDETLNLSGFEGKIIVLKDNMYFESYPISAAGTCISQGDRLVIHTNSGKHKSIIVYK